MPAGRMHPVNIGYHRLHEFRVYNRWGQQVFYTMDGSRGWDGQVNGIPADAGNYHYCLRLQLRDGKIHTFKGDVLLLR
jgi:gliding motility-associated-like protein